MKVDNKGFMQSHLNIQEDKKIFLVGDPFIESIFYRWIKENKRNYGSSRLFQQEKEVKVKHNAGLPGSQG